MTTTQSTPDLEFNFPAVTARFEVTQAHVRYCAEHGHATHRIDGQDTGTCPRCGEVKPEYLAEFARRQVERIEAVRVATGACYACDWNLRSHQHTCR